MAGCKIAQDSQLTDAIGITIVYVLGQDRRFDSKSRWMGQIPAGLPHPNREANTHSEPDVVVKNEKLTLTSVIAMIVFFLFFCFLE